MRKEFFKYLIVLASISILTMYIEMVVLPSLPTIEKQFNVSESDGSWILSSETLVGMTLSPVIGKLADTYGRKKVLLYILIFYTVSVFLTSISPNFGVLIISRSIQGIGLSINPLAYTILRERLNNRELPIAQGIIASTFAVGAAVAIPIGSYIAQYYSWQLAYETALPLLIVIIFVTRYSLPQSVMREEQKIDSLGILLLSSSFLTIGISLTEAPTLGWLSFQFLSLLSLGLILFYFFLRHISRAENPLINVSDFKNPNIAVPLLSSFVTGFGLFLTFQSLVFMLELPKPVGYNMTIFEAGLTMSPIALILLIAGPFFGSLVNKVGYKKIILSTSSFSVIAILTLSYLIGLKVSLIELMLLLVLVLFFISGMNITRITLLLASTSKRRMATITGTNTSMRLMGNTLGPIIAGSIESTFRQPLLLTIYNGIPLFTFIPSILAFQYSFLISGIIIVGVIMLATKIREERVSV
ncbi:MFS transporter [Sulfolobus sp. A20]|uniref:MFS transporter n=2 Tax=Sulfolobaceae TaxID=118883 RepID=UPI0008460179|nr:MFS transporter [Sulfolobus sp. A20]TRM75683.1 MFS transporter [Sulfolobus sp. A20-N-F8]TRM81902.1 MFS transporter [Sulfolobus sp. D5]TRM84039.1 MFS transporter [Sulfolobus sp. A20-N-F6]TRM86239.1 MFS transporter [Sulfolobus sp. C3]TRN03446.1 MFS transporter [Sulfolobus sp. F1]TRN03623.1 MFS transporter [Sulfolobus sp. E1]